MVSLFMPCRMLCTKPLDARHLPLATNLLLIRPLFLPARQQTVLNWLDFVDLNNDGQEEMMVSLYHEKKAIIYEWQDQDAINNITASA